MIRIHVDPVRKTRFACFEGSVNDDELIQTYTELLARPDFDITFHDFVDLTNVKEFDVTTTGILCLAGLVRPSLGQVTVSKLAIVAPQDHIYGMARMYQMVRQDVPRKVRVFRNADDAYSWLDLSK